MEQKHQIKVTVNGEEYDVVVSPNKTLLDLLRQEFGMTGTKRGCDEGECGACSVIFNGRVVNSCLVLAVEADNGKITTIEGLCEGEKLHPIQQAFVNSGAVQCGFCSPGMIVTTKAMLAESDRVSEEDIKHYLQGNLCRCTGYAKILNAVHSLYKQSK